MQQYGDSDIYFSIMTFNKPDSMPSELSGTDYHILTNEIVSHPNIVHIYFVDYDGTKIKGYEDKMSGIPLGLNYHKNLYSVFTDHGLPQNIQQQERRLNKYRDHAFMSGSNRRLKVYAADYLSSQHVNSKMDNEEGLLKSIAEYDELMRENKDFNVFDKHSYIDKHWRQDRRAIIRWKSYYELKDNPFVVGLENLDRLRQRRTVAEIFEERSENMFVLSPMGTGMDCFRTWEALIFGHIVIVKTSALDELYDGLPVIILNEWSEINEQNLTKWRDMYWYNYTTMNNENVTHRLTNKYWYDKMKENTFDFIANI